MVNCAKCGKKIGFFEAKYNCEDEQGNTIKYCSKCDKEFEKQSHQGSSEDKNNFDSGMKSRFEYLIQRFGNNYNNIEPPEDPCEYTGDNCWVCFDNSARWYKGFRRLCSDCVEVLESGENLNKSASSISKIKQQKRDFVIKIRQQKKEFLIKEQERDKKEEPKRKNILENLYKDKLILSYVEKNYSQCMFLDVFDEETKTLSQFIHNSKKILTKEHLISTEEQVKIGGDKFYGSILEKENKKYFVLAEYVNKLPFQILKMEEEFNCNGKIYNLVTKVQHIPIKLFKLLYKRYGVFDIQLLFKVLHNLTKEHLLILSNNLCDEEKSRERIFLYIINNYQEFIDEKEAEWFKEYMRILLNCMKKRGIINHENVDTLRKDIIDWKEESELNEFENELLNPYIPEYGLEDVDVMNGFEFEGFLLKLFTNMSYKVEQTKLSGDQGADLIIERNNNKTVVQAKCYSGKISNKAVQEVVASIKHYKASGGMIVTNSYFTPSAIKLADSNEIRLVDRDKLKELIEKHMGNLRANQFKTMDCSFNIKKGVLEIKCPKCKTKYEQKVGCDDESFKVVCPECNMELIKHSKHAFHCPTCKKGFDTINEFKNHVESCKKT